MDSAQIGQTWFLLPWNLKSRKSRLAINKYMLFSCLFINVTIYYAINKVIRIAK